MSNFRDISKVKRIVKVKIWDLPTRVFHWGLVILFLLQIYSGYKKDLFLHIPIGFCMLSLIFFRLLWGFWGSETSKFISFVKGPLKVYKYLLKIINHKKTEEIGHNPAGGWVILLMLFMIITQLLLGVFSGVLNYMVSQEISEYAWKIHKIWAVLLIIMVCVHVTANLFYLIIRKDNLIIPMITGYKKINKDIKLRFEKKSKALWLFLICTIIPLYIYFYM